MRHVAIDLETMGVSPDSAIVAIGAVEFDVGHDEDAGHYFQLGKEFYVNVDLQSSIDNGLKIDASTVYWWLMQSDEARASLVAKGDNGWDTKTDLYTALKGLSDFFEDCDAELIWARGQDFDIGILRTAYGKVGMKHPWKYNNARDSRTLYEAVGFDQSSIPSVGTAHNALSDAKWEAQAIGAAMNVQTRRLYDLRTYADKAGGHEQPDDAIMEHLVGEYGRPLAQVIFSQDEDTPVGEVPEIVPLSNMV